MFGIRQGKSMHSIDNPNAQDTKTTIAEIKRWVDEFSTERDWGKFHLPKNLAMSIAIEAAEIMEHFQWLEPDAALNSEQRQQVGEEIADVLSYVLRLASVMGIDLASTLEAKMVKNAQKYPV